jgi:hypothetical protein
MQYGELCPGVDCDKLLVAIASVETNGGRDNWPRVEAAYIPRGLSFTVQGHVITGSGACCNAITWPRWQRWGLGSAASWGWWQVLYQTAADLGYDGAPEDLMEPGVCEPFVVARLRKIATRGAKTVRDFADAWNSGTFTDDNTVPDYTAAVEAAYQKLTS